MLKSVLYVSTSQLLNWERDLQVQQIVDHSRAWNASVGITGALVATGRRFVQLIEGPPLRIDELVAMIRADRRHVAVNILEEAATDQRQFGRWTLAYAGPDTFIDEKLASMIHMEALSPEMTAKTELRKRLSAMVEQASQPVDRRYW